MADSTNPTANNSNSQNFLPRFYRTDSNKKFLQATLDQLVNPGTVKKINGYIGRQNAKATTGNDIFLSATDNNRQNYQLEPGLVVRDELGNTTFFRDYVDYVNQIKVFGGNTTNHSRLNKQEFYSWDPHIDWDKFVNFQNYYWLPYGPDIIKVFGQKEQVISEFTVTVESEGDNNTYVFNPPGLVRNPTIKLYRGQTYTFNINAPGNPFSIKTTRSTGSFNRYINYGLTGSAVTQGTITLTIPHDAPDVLYYQSETDIDLGGVFQILSIEENTFIDVETELIGKVNYTLPNGTALSNGMKISFVGRVAPEQYAVGKYYVEGVGKSIYLINENSLEMISNYTAEISISFDDAGFDLQPFSDATSYAGSPDYILVNRGSKDLNPWSRYNRWFHKDVIEASALANGKIASLDQTKRAVRPIIEFESNLKLFNFGTNAIADVDLIDTYTTDVFSTIEGSLGYNIDGVDVAAGQRILFTADTDRFVKNNIYRVEFVEAQDPEKQARVRQIHLVQEELPAPYQSVLVKQGLKNQGSMYWYDGDNWTKSQQKTSLNQPPLFDIVDTLGISYGNITVYDGSTFLGTKLFSYKVGTGPIDENLGFPLSYKNINNTGDIVFNFDLASDTFQYKDVVNVVTKSVNVGYLIKTVGIDTIVFANGWQTSVVDRVQAAVRIYKNSNLVNNFELDMFDKIQELSDLVVKVYINGIRLDPSLWQVVDGPYYKKIVLSSNIDSSDVLTIKAYSAQPINDNGHYEIPFNLQNNPSNNLISNFTLGEVIDHVGSIVDNISTFSGAYPGAGNLRDLGNITAFGTKFVQHSGPLSLTIYHTTSQSNNIVRAIEQSRDDYNKFKRNFVAVAEKLGVDANIPTQVDLILQLINKDKPTTAPYYFSDMVPYGAATTTTIEIVDDRIKTYPLTNVFNLDTLSSKSVLVYLNGLQPPIGTQLLYQIHYTFNDQGFVVINDNVNLAVGNTITIIEYDSTDGSFVPETPTKLGIWPRYEPKIYLDTSYITPRNMLQGHDGSLVLAYNDYRDDLILELEKRIFNNIKVNYDTTIFDVADVIPNYNRNSDYSLTEFNEILAPNFYHWTSYIDRDFSKPFSYNRDNSFTFNYKGHIAPDGRQVPGYWRGIYQWILDTDRPHSHPWEMLGLSIKPVWWEELYGLPPYTKDNLVMWQDISNGLIYQPGLPSIIATKYAKPFLMQHIPVDEFGNLVSPAEAGLANGVLTTSTEGDFIFGDISPIENAWRKSSHYPFSVIITAMLMNPAKTFGLLLDRSRVSRDVTGQIVYKDTGLRIKPADVVLPSIYSSKTRTQTAGIINYVVNYILSDNLKSYKNYQYDIKNLTPHLSYRIGAFTSKEKFNLLLDSKTPLSAGSVFIPQENYEIILNSSSPIKRITYSGVIITKLQDGFEIKGYSRKQLYFKYYPFLTSGVSINVGGISESFVTWSANNYYSAGKIVLYNKRYYRVKTTHTSSVEFNTDYFQQLASLPIVGGRNAIFRNTWDRTEEITVPYGTKFRTVQEVVDFLTGYGEWLKDQGFIFDDFNNNLGKITNWETSAKEFLFWTTQNWSTGEDKWDEWSSAVEFKFGSIVRYNGDYYKANKFVKPNPIFQEDAFDKLDGLSTVGSSVLSLSPSAIKVTFKATLAVVDDVTNSFNGYDIFTVAGTPIDYNFLNSYREDNAVSYTPSGDDGIYGATFYLVQKEQVVILDNTTMFNDTIYNPESGYRQERINVSGYVSSTWNGSFDVPGFIFDQANIADWEAWQDYALGDIIKYKEYYYSASKFLPGAETFAPPDWIKLDKKPTPQLLPNWTYKATQFTDFYNLDSDNFDVNQQKMAQHLIGYQKRQYLSNIIKDDTSELKFYQGMIIEKGTQNVLNKLFDVLSADGEESLKFYEEWAIRVGQYGASESYDNIEFVLPEELFKNNPQAFELVNIIDPSIVDFVIRQTPNDVYLKPIAYNSNPWPIVKDYKPYLRSAGYARPEQVKLTLKNIDEIVNQDITLFDTGDYVWCSFDKASWNIYRYTSLDTSVTAVNNNPTLKELKITTRLPLGIDVNSYVGINQVSGFTGFYKVISVELNVIVLDTTGKDIVVADPFTEQDSMILHVFKTQRVDSIDNLNTVLPASLKLNETVWTDNGGNGKWAVWQYYPVYTGDSIFQLEPYNGEQFGKNVAVTKNSKILAALVSSGEVVVHDKAGPTQPWLKRATIPVSFAGTTTYNYTFNPTTVAISPDGTWLATGSPDASNVKTNYVGDYNPATTYVVDKIVSYNQIYYKAIQPVPANTLPPTNQLYWRHISLVPIETSGTGSGLTNQGMVSLYKKDANNIYNLVNSFTSLTPANNERFGSNLVFGADKLFITSSGYNNSVGKVYELKYSTLTKSSSAYNPNGSNGTTVVLSNTAGIEVGMTVVGTGFTGQTVVEINSPTTITISAEPLTTPSGIISFTVIDWYYNLLFNATGSVVGNTAIKDYGYQLSVSNDNSTLLISNNYRQNVTDPNSPLVGTVDIYKLNSSSSNYTLYQTIAGSELTFGASSTVSNSGSYIAISSTLADSTQVDQGKVFVYKAGTLSYNLYQTVVSNNPEISGFFGAKVNFINDSGTLVIYSSSADTVVRWDLSDNTTFDNETTNFIYASNIDSGRVDVFDRYGSKWIYSESIPTTNTLRDGYGFSIAVSDNNIYVGAPYTLSDGISIEVSLMAPGSLYKIETLGNTDFISYGEQYTASGIWIPKVGDIFRATIAGVGSGTVVQQLVSGKIYTYSKPENTSSWTIIDKEIEKPDVSKIKQAFLYNKSSSQLITYLDIIDPNQGKIAGVADEEIKFKTFYDPAVYSIGNTTVNVDDGIAWKESQVGTLWWDLRTAKFVNAYSSDIVYRNSTWSTLATGASIDVYEWVGTKHLPADWDAIADTETGLASGISGTSLYGNSAYSIVKRYDKISKTFKNTYYYWVKNKKTVPDVSGRSIPAGDVASLIANPRGQGYQYLALTGTNSFSLVNVKSSLHDSDVVLSAEYWTIDKTDQNIHAQWKLISENSSSQLPQSIEEKWFDSLCGKDANDRLIPDMNLPPKLRYGIENRPRQGMFVNRFEALKQFVERANIVLESYQIVKNRDITDLQSTDPEPSVITGLYDTVIDTDAELRFAGVGAFTRPTFGSVTVVDGAITAVSITFSGRGYIVAPFITVTGAGTGAIIKAKISTLGKVTGVEIINGGQGYDSTTTALTIRDYSVLVHSDSQALNTWSIYSYDPVYKTWSRTLSQTYDTTKYWTYIDWYASGYNQFNAIDHSVDTFADLNRITPLIGQLVRIRTDNSGNWVLLRKYANSSSIDWTQSYVIVGAQNGTIQLSSTLYKFDNSTVGYDSALFDGNIFDSSASKELRIILNSLKDKILIDDLKEQYLKLFFTCVRYALVEQNYIDWIFKTSFVKSKHNVGELKQKVTYNSDNLENYEDYVNEVKPYRTKVREYISSYNKTDTSELSVTDFDLLPTYENGKVTPINTTVVNGKIEADNANILSYPWKHWLDNVGFTITELALVNGGSDYVTEPVVRIVGDSGSGATGRAFIANGKVNRIVLLTPGKGYLKAPTVYIEGGLSPTGTAARAVAIIGNSVVRSNLIKMKFDRITQTYFITQLQETETFTSTGARYQFALKWAPNIRIGQTKVTINGVEALREHYNLLIVKSTVKGYTSYTGKLTFTVAPPSGPLVITYIKDWSLLNAADRIQYYYDPASGDLGKDLSQLMTGIDYGGVVIDGLGFDVSQGWGSLPYFSDKWDSADPTFDDYITTVSAGTHEFTLPYTPPTDTKINVYHIKTNIDSYTSNGTTLLYNYTFAVNNPSIVVTKISQAKSVQTTYGSHQSVDTVAVSKTGINIIGSGSNALFGIKRNNNEYDISILAAGSGYAVNDIIKILGTEVFGVSPNNDIRLTVIGVGSGGAITEVSVAGIATTTLTVLSTSGIVVGMTLLGTGFTSLQTVVSIVNGTRLIISASPDVTPFGTITFTKNIAGSNILSLNTTVGISIGDTLTIPTLPTFSYGYVVDSIINGSEVRLNQIIYLNIPGGTPISFSHTLVEPTDVTIYNNGTFLLTTPIIAGNLIQVIGLLPPIRIDDDNFVTTAVTLSGTIVDGGLSQRITTETFDAGDSLAGFNPAIDPDLNGGNSSNLPAVTGSVMVTPINKSVASVRIDNPGSYTVKPTVTIGQSPLVSSSTDYNATLGIVTMNVVSATIVGGNPGIGYHINDILTVGTSTFKVKTLTGSFGVGSVELVTAGETTGSLPQGPRSTSVASPEIFVNSFISKVGTGIPPTPVTGPYFVTLSIPIQPGVPRVGSNYTLVGNLNPNYNGSWLCSSSTLITITLEFPTDPGDWDDTQTTVIRQPLGSGCNLVLRYGIKSISVETKGSGYVDAPPVTISSGLATATAILTNTIYVPSSYFVNDGDQFIFRKSTSDGSIKPQERDYDTALSGGDLAYATATGLAAEDILVDGDGFVTPTTSPAPEEVVPGQVVDAVAIKIYDKPSTGSANIKVDNHIADGVVTDFSFTQMINSQQAVIVKVSDATRVGSTIIPSSSIKSINIDYTVDYKNKLIKFAVAPTAKQVVSIFNFGFSGSGILDLDYFVADGTTTEFITKAPWITPVTSLVYIDGIATNPDLFQTDQSYDSAKRIGIRFGNAPEAGSLINFVIVSGSTQTFAVTKTEKIPTNGSLTYNLSYDVGDSLPIESNMIVRVDQQILKTATNNYFTIKNNRLNYNLDPAKFLPYTLDINDIVVYAEGNQLAIGTDYIIDLSGITVKITRANYSKYSGKQLIVTVNKGAEYIYIPRTVSNPPRITFNTAYTSNDYVEVISSYNHNVLDIERTTITVTSSLELIPDTLGYYNYTRLTSGILTLDREIIDDQYVWVTKNGRLLSPSVDYILLDDKLSIKLDQTPSLNDEYNLITFSNNVLTTGIAYMQFKDMLNRTHFKRLSLNKQTRLTKDLRYNDLTITVDDATSFDIPNPTFNKPGAVEIRGERIEYFSKTGNILGQLRRGTLGTGTPVIHVAGSFVQDIGAGETIPYSENSIIQQIVSDATNTVNLTFTPTKGSTADTTGVASWFTSFGYNFKGNYSPTLLYAIKDVVLYNGYYYKNISSSKGNTPTDATYWSLHSTIPAGYGQSNDIEVFVGGYDDITPWAPGVAYAVGKIITIGSYTYRCIGDHTSSDTFGLDMDYWNFFVGNIRLKKAPYAVYNVNNAPESPEGDVEFDADFAVNGTTSQLRLTNTLKFGTRVTVIKRTGVSWDGTLNIQNDDNKISRFLKATPGIWYTNIVKSDAVLATSFDSGANTFDTSSQTFDQG